MPPSARLHEGHAVGFGEVGRRLGRELVGGAPHGDVQACARPDEALGMQRLRERHPPERPGAQATVQALAPAQAHVGLVQAEALQGRAEAPENVEHLARGPQVFAEAPRQVDAVGAELSAPGEGGG